mgnify:CR=1 FL=1
METNQIQLVTAFFDINRHKVDGRKNSEYAKQLVVLLKEFPSTLLITDRKSFESLNLHHRHHLITTRDSLWPFSMRDEVARILSNFEPGKAKDITHRLPDYSLVNISKLPLMLLALERTGATTAVWLDAGISRFFPPGKSTEVQLLNKVRELNEMGFESGFEIETTGNISLFTGRLRNAQPGSCRRIVSGTSFFATKAYLKALELEARLEIERWFQSNTWDNDQVLLRRIIPKMRHKTFFHRQRGEPASILRWLLSPTDVSSEELAFSKRISKKIGN